MARDLNQVFLIGRLTRDIEVNTTKSGKNVGNFALAVNRSNEDVDFIECVAWDKTAELLQQYTSKGSKILVQGSLQIRSYEAKDGTNRKVSEIQVRDISFLDPKSDSQSTQKDVAPTDIDDKPIDLSEIPF